MRIRGIPESIVDLQTFATSLFQDLTPSIPQDRLEFQRIHRALTRRQKDGLPRDIIIKFQYYRTKESILQEARRKSTLTFQGYDYQIFADLAPSTISKRREIKPILQVLQQHGIAYRWGFPFKLIFSYGGRQYQPTTLQESRGILENLNLSLERSPGHNHKELHHNRREGDAPDAQSSRILSQRTRPEAPSRFSDSDFPG